MTDFVMVGALTVFLFLALVQLALTVHVRNVLIDCAAQGAQFAALADRDAGAGAARTRTLVTKELSAGYADQVAARLVEVEGIAMVEVEIRAPVPVAGLIGIGRSLTVTGHAWAEAP